MEQTLFLFVGKGKCKTCFGSSNPLGKCEYEYDLFPIGVVLYNYLVLAIQTHYIVILLACCRIYI